MRPDPGAAIPSLDPRALDSAALIDHIVAHHQEYLREALPFVQGLAPAVARRYGARDDRLRDLDVAVDELVEALIPHLVSEEQSLFPALRAPVLDHALISRELASMHDDHRRVDALIAQLRAATDAFTPPDDADTDCRALFAELEMLAKDIRVHVHLEDDILAARFSPWSVRGASPPST